MEVPQKSKIELPYDPANLRVYDQGNEIKQDSEE